MEAQAGELLERCWVLAVTGDVLDGRLVLLEGVVGVVRDLLGDRALAAGQQRHLMPGLHQLPGQVHTNKARAACTTYLSVSQLVEQLWGSE